MAKTNNPNNSIVNVNPGQGEDSPAVLAYRVGELEKASRAGFKDLSDKLELMSHSFATHKDIDALKLQSKMEHDSIYEDVGRLRSELSSVKNRTWVQNTMSAIFGAILALLIAYAFNGIFNS